jgi:hypothetical protein
MSYYNTSVFVNKTIVNNDTDGEADFYMGDIPENNNITFFCEAHDYELSSNYTAFESHLIINHGMSFQLRSVIPDGDFYAYNYYTFINYCNIENLNDTQIHSSWADCNNDNQFDYYIEYNNSVQSSAQFFTCSYRDEGIQEINIGCVIERMNNSLQWNNNNFCKDNIKYSDNYCNVAKGYKIAIH